MLIALCVLQSLLILITQKKSAYTDITTHMVKTLKRTVLIRHMMVIPERKVGTMDMMGLTTLTQHTMEIPEREVSTVNLTMSSLTFHKVSISLCDHRHTYGLKYVRPIWD